MDEIMSFLVIGARFTKTELICVCSRLARIFVSRVFAGYSVLQEFRRYFNS